MASSNSPDSEGRSPGGDTPQDPGRFRGILSTLPLGVVAVTAIDRGEPVGLAIGSFLAMSMDPPIAGFVASVSSTSFPRIRRAGTFCANILTEHQQHISQAFAASGADKFAGLSWRPAPVTGSPVLEGAAAWVDCRITTVHETGDHLLVIGEVADLGETPGEMPLVFHRGRYTRMETEKQASHDSVPSGT